MNRAASRTPDSQRRCDSFQKGPKKAYSRPASNVIAAGSRWPGKIEMKGRRLAVPRKLSDLMAIPLDYLIDTTRKKTRPPVTGRPCRTTARDRSEDELQAKRGLIIILQRRVGRVFGIEGNIRVFEGDLQLLPVQIVVRTDAVPFLVVILDTAVLDAVIGFLVSPEELQATLANLVGQHVAGLDVIALEIAADGQCGIRTHIGGATGVVLEDRAGQRVDPARRRVLHERVHRPCLVILDVAAGNIVAVGDAFLHIVGG